DMAARHWLGKVVLLLAAALPALPAHAAQEEALRVCADPNNLPYSNAAGEGFENALAELLAADLGRRVEYTWWPQRRGFFRETLQAGLCDVVMGVAVGASQGASTTTAYYRSGYAFVTRAEDELRLRGLDDPRLRELRIGLHTVGDDYANTPPAQALIRRGIRDRVQGFPIYGDYSRPAPAGRLIAAVAAGEIDVAMVWGPIGGYFAQVSAVPLRTQLLEAGAEAQSMSFDIAMATRKEDEGLRAALQGSLERQEPQVRALLLDYAIPVLTHGPDRSLAAEPA